MTALASQVALGIALKCLPPAPAPISVGITRDEIPKLDLQAINHSANGTSDYGLARINSANFAWLSRSMRTPVNERTIFDPCINLQVSMRVLCARYNSNTPDVLKAAYAAGVMAKIPAGVEALQKRRSITTTRNPCLGGAVCHFGPLAQVRAPVATIDGVASESIE